MRANTCGAHTQHQPQKPLPKQHCPGKSFEALLAQKGITAYKPVLAKPCCGIAKPHSHGRHVARFPAYGGQVKIPPRAMMRPDPEQSCKGVAAKPPPHHGAPQKPHGCAPSQQRPHFYGKIGYLTKSPYSNAPGLVECKEHDAKHPKSIKVNYKGNRFAEAMTNEYKETGKTADVTAIDALRSELERKYGVKIMTEACFAGAQRYANCVEYSNGHGNVFITSNILEEMLKDPAAREKYENMLQDYNDWLKSTRRDLKGMGMTAEASGLIICPDGRSYSWVAEGLPSGEENFRMIENTKPEYNWWAKRRDEIAAASSRKDLRVMILNLSEAAS